MNNEIKEKAQLEDDKKYLKDMRISYLKNELKNTDYIASKLTEAISNYLITNDLEPVKELRFKYSTQLENREKWRNEIDSLQKGETEL